MLDHRKFRAGDPTTAKLFLDFVRRHVWKFFNKQSQVDEVSQSAILEMLTKLEAGNEPVEGQTLYWLLNCSNNAVRRELTRLRHAATVAYESRLHSQDVASQDDALQAHRELVRIDALLGECNAKTRLILAARASGYAYKEIADEYGFTPGAVRTTLTRARAQLTARLTAQERLDQMIKQAEHLGLHRTRS